MIERENLTFGEDHAEEAAACWKAREEIHRLILEHRIDAEDYLKDRDQIEKAVMKIAADAEIKLSNTKQLVEIMNHALAEERKLQDRYLSQAKDRKPVFRGNLYFNHYWKKTNERLRKS
jgi:hypothetical protein